MNTLETAKKFCSHIINENGKLSISNNAPGVLRELINKVRGDWEDDPFRLNFTLQSIQLIAINSTPLNPYEKDNFQEEIYKAAVDGNIELREWLHSRMERAEYLAKAQQEFGPIFDGSELMIVARYIEEKEIFTIVEETLKKLVIN